MTAVSELHASITEGLHEVGLPGIQVEVAASGEVTLLGAITDPAQEAEAVDIAFMRGASDVVSRLTYEGLGDAAASYVAREHHEDPASDAPPDESKRTYEVQKGDSWWRIATKHWGDGRKFPLLKAANPQLKGLHPGDIVIVPGVADDADYHVVQKGDSYWALADRYWGDGTRHEDLKRANPDIGSLQPGKVLRIPRRT